MHFKLHPWELEFLCGVKTSGVVQFSCNTCIWLPNIPAMKTFVKTQIVISSITFNYNYQTHI